MAQTTLITQLAQFATTTKLIAKSFKYAIKKTLSFLRSRFLLAKSKTEELRGLLVVESCSL